MLIDPHTLRDDLETLEDIEKASLRLVLQALFDYRDYAVEIFREEVDLPADIAEDVTREALDVMGMSRIDQRLLGKVDYKRARYVFHPDYSIKQALFVDSKAEKVEGQRTVTLQTSQVSMRIRLIQGGGDVDEPGKLDPVVEIRGEPFLVTTIFVKYNYGEDQKGIRTLESIRIAALPNGMLQDIYNPNATDTIWLVGRHAPTRGEDFRVRMSFEKLSNTSQWRVQEIPIPATQLDWRDTPP